MLQKGPADNAAKARVLGVNPYFFKEYDAAIRSYRLPRCMRGMSLLAEYDFKWKGGETGEADAAALLMELITKILNI